MAVIRGNCWEAGCHGAAEARAALPGCPGFLGCPTITAARGTHGEGGEASSLLTGIVQRKVRVRGRGGGSVLHRLSTAGRGTLAGTGHCLLFSHGSGALPVFPAPAPNPPTVRPALSAPGTCMRGVPGTGWSGWSSSLPSARHCVGQTPSVIFIPPSQCASFTDGAMRLRGHVPSPQTRKGQSEDASPAPAPRPLPRQ